MIKIAFFDTKSYDKACFTAQNNQEITFKFFETKLTEDTVNLAKGYDGVCVFVNDKLNFEVIEALHSYGVRVIALRCAGYNNVDTIHAKGKLAVLNVPSYSPYAVAEHAIGMLLTLNRKIHRAYIRTKDFNFSLSGLTGFDLHGKTVGVIGTGKIGKVFINICKGFGVKIIAYDKYPDKNSDIAYVSLNKLFAESDIISFHCPLNGETYHMLNKKTVKSLKRGVIIINTSRGALIDAEALLTAIKDGKVGGACLDVYEEESEVFFEDFSGHILTDDVLARLISMPNVLLTSHQAFLTEEALSNIAITTINNILSYFSTGKCENEVIYKR